MGEGGDRGWERKTGGVEGDRANMEDNKGWGRIANERMMGGDKG